MRKRGPPRAAGDLGKNDVVLIDNTSIPPWGIGSQGLTPEQAEALAIQLIFDGNPVALAAHALGLASRAEPRPLRLHEDDVESIAQRVAVLLSLGEQSAQVARATQRGTGRYTGTAMGDRTAAGRADDPFVIHTAQELSTIEKQNGVAA